MKKLINKKNWNRKETALFVQATPGELFSRRVQAICDQSGMNVKVVERGRRTVRQLLQKSDVCPAKGCGRMDCWLCDTDGRKGMCHKEGVKYCINCVIGVVRRVYRQ